AVPAPPRAAVAARPPSRHPPPQRVRRPLLVVVVALVLVACGFGAYFGARETGIFALDRIQVIGAPPSTAGRIRAALRGYVGKSLVRFDRNDAARRLAAVSEVADARFDRDFPHTLRIRVRLERPVAILRRGPDAWLVS